MTTFRRAARDAATEDMTKAALAAALELQTAMSEIAPIVGEVYAESAEEAYRYCLDRCNIDLTDIDPSVFRAMVRLLNPDGTFKRTPRALDSASATSFASRFPNVSRVRIA